MKQLKKGIKHIQTFFTTRENTEHSQEYNYWKNEQYLQREKVLREHEMQEALSSRFIY